MSRRLLVSYWFFANQLWSRHDYGSNATPVPFHAGLAIGTIPVVTNVNCRTEGLRRIPSGLPTGWTTPRSQRPPVEKIAMSL